MRADDGPTVLAIYGEGIASGHSTFQDKTPAWDEWDSGHLKKCRTVAESEGRVIGWVALSTVSPRQVYSGVCEVSIYLASDMHGMGVGERLMAALIEASEVSGLWTLQAGIFPENTASINLHRKFGFRVVGIRERLGRMIHGPLAGQWRDVILLERRSLVVI